MPSIGFKEAQRDPLFHGGMLKQLKERANLLKETQHDPMGLDRLSGLL